MAFTDVDDFQASFNTCVTVSVGILLDSAQIPEFMIPMTYARLAELTAQELEVSCSVRLSSLNSFSQIFA